MYVMYRCTCTLKWKKKCIWAIQMHAQYICVHFPEILAFMLVHFTEKCWTWQTAECTAFQHGFGSHTKDSTKQLDICVHSANIYHVSWQNLQQSIPNSMMTQAILTDFRMWQEQANLRLSFGDFGGSCEFFSTPIFFSVETKPQDGLTDHKLKTSKYFP